MAQTKWNLSANSNMSHIIESYYHPCERVEWNMQENLSKMRLWLLTIRLLPTGSYFPCNLFMQCFIYWVDIPCGPLAGSAASNVHQKRGPKWIALSKVVASKYLRWFYLSQSYTCSTIQCRMPLKYNLQIAPLKSIGFQYKCGQNERLNRASYGRIYLQWTVH